MKEAHNEGESDQTERYRKEEEPAPSECVRNPAANQRAENRGHAKDGTHDPLVLTAATCRDEIANNGLGERLKRSHS